MHSKLESVVISSIRAFSFGLALLVFGQSAAVAAAGKIQFIAGEVKIINAQKVEREAKKGEALESGDTIVTGTSGSVQVALADGGLIAVRPNSQLKIDDYVYTGKPDDSKNKSFFSLGKGTFRSITGAIGQNNKDAYRVTTPTATMGIRGTDHEPAFVLPLPPGVQPLTPLQAAAPGTYDRVNSGVTFMQTPFGIVVLGPNQVGFAPAGGAPVILPQIPGFYSATPRTKTAKAGADAKKSDSATGGSASGGTSGDSSGSSASTSGSSNENTVSTFGSNNVSAFPTITDTSLVTNQTITSNTTLATAANGGAGATPPPPPYTPLPGVVTAYVIDPMVGGTERSVFLDDPSKSILVGNMLELLAISDPITSPSFQFDANTGVLVEQGTTLISDGSIVDWGRWSTGYTVTENGQQISNVGDFHYAFSNVITDPVLVTMPGALVGGAYTYVGGTAPTDFNGVPGALTSNTSLLVDFAGQMVTLNVESVIGVSLPVVLNGSATGTIANFITPTVGITGTTPAMNQMTGNNTLKATGFFVGPTADGAFASFSIRNDMTGDGAVGTAVFDRNAPPPL